MKAIWTKYTARVLLYSMLAGNLLPTFVYANSDYQIRIRRTDYDSGFTVEVMRLVNDSECTSSKYLNVFKTEVSPFMHQPFASNDIVAFQEILQRLDVYTQKTGVESVIHTVATDSAERYKTLLSRGYHLSIPEIGDLLIAHNGDVLLNANTDHESLSIIAPDKVLLNNVRTKDIDIEAAAVFLTGGSISQVQSLNFRAHISNAPINGLFIDENSRLDIARLQIENALLLNLGHLTITDRLDLHGGCIFNSGRLTSHAPSITLSNISKLFNCSKGILVGDGIIKLTADNIVNSGTITATEAHLNTSAVLENRGTINTDNKLHILNLQYFTI